MFKIGHDQIIVGHRISVRNIIVGIDMDIQEPFDDLDVHSRLKAFVNTIAGDVGKRVNSQELRERGLGERPVLIERQRAVTLTGLAPFRS